MARRILTEAAGSMVSGFMIKAIQSAGHVAVASDITSDCAGALLADEMVRMPSKSDPALWERVEQLLQEHRIDMVIPSFDEMLLGWAQRRDQLRERGVDVLVSDPETVRLFQDKWLSYEFFCRHGIPCAATSLAADYPLVKPRSGRGSEGVFVEEDPAARVARFQPGDISQELLTGEEYTVDCLFDREGLPVYRIPRKRIGVVNGKSTGGIVESNDLIVREIEHIARCARFVGPVNIQCFVDAGRPEGSRFHMVEINPRIAGGAALGFAATENWVPRFVDLVEGKSLEPVPARTGLKMYRTYQELFTL